MLIQDVIGAAKEDKRLRDCIGRVSAEHLDSPSGHYPILLMGERIKEEHLALIDSEREMWIVK